MYSAMVDDLTSRFLDDVTVTMMLSLDDRWTKSGLFGDVTEDHLHHIRVMTDSTVRTVDLTAGQDMWHRLCRPTL